MSILQSLGLNTKRKSFQNKNKAVFDCMVENGFLLPDIRNSLRVLNRLRLEDIADGGLSKAAISNTIAGRRMNREVMDGLAKNLELDVRILFTDSNE